MWNAEIQKCSERLTVLKIDMWGEMEFTAYKEYLPVTISRREEYTDT